MSQLVDVWMCKFGGLSAYNKLFNLWFDILVYLLIIFNVMLFTFYKVAPKTAKAIHQFLVKLRAYAKGKSAFTFTLED